MEVTTKNNIDALEDLRGKFLKKIDDFPGKINMGEDKLTVLVIDDEPNNLLSAKALLRRQFNVLSALNMNEVQLIFKKHKIDICVCDMRMPNISGIEIAEWIANKYPKTKRLATTAYSDYGSLVEMINRGKIHGFIQKPWNKGEMQAKICKLVA